MSRTVISVLIGTVVIGLVALGACNVGPTNPTSSSSSTPVSGEPAVRVHAAEDARLQSLAVQLAALDPADESTEVQQEVERVRSLIAALTAELDGANGGAPADPPPASRTVTVSILGQRGNESFSPNPAAPGEEGVMVVWRNDDGVTHRIVANDGSFDTGNLVAGATSLIVQPQAGDVDYHCSLHPTTMFGSIRGAGAAPGDGAPDDGDGVSDPYAALPSGL